MNNRVVQDFHPQTLGEYFALHRLTFDANRRHNAPYGFRDADRHLEEFQLEPQELRVAEDRDGGEADFTVPSDRLACKLLRIQAAQRGESPAQSTSSSTPRRANTRERGRLHDTCRNRSLLSALFHPQTRREEVRALRILAALVLVLLGYPAALALPHLALAFGVFARWITHFI